MKKTITINLAGVVFHIEEDAYEILQKYLGSVKQYFLNIQGGAEIQDDIEARIAELFSDLISESKQAISIEDVEAIVKQLGSVEDMMDEDDIPLNPSGESSGQNQSSASGSFEEQKKLSRDSANALIGGVLSGVAAYFGVNPLWLRLGVVALFFGFTILPSLGGSILVGYLILWIVMPANPNLENKGKFKKFLRSRKDQIVAGVSGGIGAYFNIDPVIIRIIFLVTTFFGGVGLITYIVLWAITPEAKSLTDEIQMEGNPVTLNSIEDQIRKNVKLDDEKAKNNVVRLLSFPFKLMSMVVTGLGPLVKFAFDAIRVFVALILLLLGSSFLFAIVILAGVGLGWIEPNAYSIQTGDFPLGRLASEISPLMVFFASSAAMIPAILLLLLSFSLMAKRNLIIPVVGLVLVGLFFIGAIGSAITIIPFAQKFKEEGNYVETIEYKIKSELVSLNLNPVEGNPDGIYPLELEIHGWEDSTFKLTKRFKAQGKNRKEASSNARLALLNVVQQDSSLIFDSDLTIDPNTPYRAQRLTMNLYVPYGRKFTIDRELSDMLRNTLYPNGYNVGQLEGNVWLFNKKGLKCLTCKEKSEEIQDATESENEEENVD